MKYVRNHFALLAALLACSFILYFVHFLLFRTMHDIVFYLVMDIAFLPVQVLLLTLFINRLLSERERQMRLEKLNMVIGVFFSDVGRHVLTFLTRYDVEMERISPELMVDTHWTDNRFMQARRQLLQCSFMVSMSRLPLAELKSTLLAKRAFMLGLLENPNLLEHETFTDLLRGIFHLLEELEYRSDCGTLPEKDIQHLQADIARAYRLLVLEWCEYMRYLQHAYPYLFSFAMRTNPFMPAIDVIFH